MNTPGTRTSWTVNFFGPSLTWPDYFGLDRDVPFGTVHCGGA
ncbi:hypothetical protein FDG2_0490 [Candidatus Protofrankia californiensis]|uniref:Uncharacterized protein n=1 Tax=Candidatus Protofrankia californiensis TaxID=1839754 RepID=A0A1C3NTM3_9ACTN|nr:hypothetical protein FDG2_0490 [Candidatus Protofrankia californiensis]